jgi:prepilin-type N-terminal cleavage/methylation domain-containing protein
MSDSSGFTLIEAVIVLALIGILSAISVISLVQWLPGYHLKAAAQDLFNKYALRQIPSHY